MSFDERVHIANDAAPNADGQYVLYWMQSARRMRSNFALDRAVFHAEQHALPLVIVETWARARTTPRHTKFVLEGMRDNQKIASAHDISYVSYVEPREGKLAPFLHKLAADASVVVTDQVLTPPVSDGIAIDADVRVERVDGNGIYPVSATEKAAPSAYVFRRWLQKALQNGWTRPQSHPLENLDLPRAPLDTPALPEFDTISFADPDVGVVSREGGSKAGSAALHRFIKTIDSYPDDRNHPDASATSRLSPYLHFGHVAATDVVDAVLAEQDWDVDQTGKPQGKRAGWWNLDAAREAFLDQIVTWREVGFHFAWHQPGYARYETLPQWAIDVLQTHSADPRPITYSLEQLESATTHDDVWNAAQRELLQTGYMHNYLRMLWGKKILEWSDTPQQAFERAVYLNDRWALDGSDPNSYSGIGWVFGRFDRPWGPRREIFGTIRYMSSDSARRKLRLKNYLVRFGA